MSGQRENVCFLAPDCSGARRELLVAVYAFVTFGCEVDVSGVTDSNSHAFVDECLFGNRTVGWRLLSRVLVFRLVSHFQLLRLILADGMGVISLSCLVRVRFGTGPPGVNTGGPSQARLGAIPKCVASNTLWNTIAFSL